MWKLQTWYNALWMNRKLKSIFSSHIIAALLLLAFLLIAGAALCRETSNYRFVVISDSHMDHRNGHYCLNPPTERIIRAITEDVKPAFVIHCGDMITFTEAANTEKDLMAMWDVFRKGVVDRFLKSGIAFFPAQGNHDIAGKGTAKYSAIWKHFANRDIKLDSGDYSGNYALHYGNSLFVSLIRSNPEMKGKDLAWFRRTMSEYRSRFTHVFVFCHIGLLIGEESFSNLPRDRELEDLLRKYDVDYFLSGHYHMAFDSKAGPTEYITCGAAGEPLISSFIVFNVNAEKITWEQRGE